MTTTATEERSEPVLDGVCAPGFEGVRELLRHNLETGVELGASLCVMSGEEVVVDLWGGTADAASGRPWTRDTVVNTYSITKTMTALAALVLVDRGLLDPDAPVAEYWPEFAAAGKQTVLVRHVLGHTSGLSGWDERMRVEDLYDTPSAADLLARQAPWWTPGASSGYHAMSFGTLVGELVRRITGVSLGQFFAAEVAVPLGADYWIGAPESLLAQPERIATLVPPPPTGFDYASLPTDSLMLRTLTNPAFAPALTTDPGFLAAELGAANGQGNARSVALVQSVITCGGTVGGRRFAAPETVGRIFEVQADGRDPVLGAHVRFGLGWALPSPSMPGVPAGRACWWTGFGGSVVVADLDRNLTIAYVMNKMGPQLVGSARANRYLDAVYGR
ncbi:beta-lactamase family protein [Rhodococcus sp. D2-41]|uniref:Beta-lactamase family protein n=1 Tax=Speluncibacter jeojiensis TaxID=2710754 RepID=A0A9X4LZZ6_9ACTN|nr:serine hydrolase domain-containing protein [Rhodococcus sp. D2-41]MDG3012329.1 beta-lactamase family protein [Rhodococcus sp. D2-41]MDG3014696.1 beta-lactamase family protein [Corynebacteriales bacterium D3-21]